MGEENGTTVFGLLNRMAEEFCDHYCKWPEECKTEGELVDHCWECPINLLGN